MVEVWCWCVNFPVCCPLCYSSFRFRMNWFWDVYFSCYLLRYRSTTPLLLRACSHRGKANAKAKILCEVWNLFEFFLNGAELSLSLGKLIATEAWTGINFPVSHMCLAGTVVASWSLTQEVAGSSPFAVMTLGKSPLLLFFDLFRFR